MASLIVAGDTSGSVTIAAPAIASTPTLTLPTVSGTFITTGSSGQVIPKAALPTGSVLQVVSSRITTNTTTTSGSYVDTAVSLAITPTSSSSKVLVILNPCLYATRNGTSFQYGDVYFNIVRGSTEVNFGRIAINFGVTTWNDFISQPSIMHLDSPATTSSTTYKMQIYTSASGTSIQNNISNIPSTITLMEIAS